MVNATSSVMFFVFLMLIVASLDMNEDEDVKLNVWLGIPLLLVVISYTVTGIIEKAPKQLVWAFVYSFIFVPISYRLASKKNKKIFIDGIATGIAIFGVLILFLNIIFSPMVAKTSFSIARYTGVLTNPTILGFYLNVFIVGYAYIIYKKVFVEKNTLYFNVYDSGIGISEDNIQNIFESFVQIGKEQSGAGLGLSITKKLLKVLNGTIEVESKVGQGSTFKIQIPIETSQKEFENFSDVVSKLLNSNNSGIKTIFLKSILKLPLRIKDLKDAHKKQDIEEVRKINHLIKGTYGNLNLTLVYDISEKISLELKKENVSFDSILHYIEELEYLTHTLDYNELFNTYLQFKERKIKILIAEDAEETRDFLKALLETSLIEVTCVENGLEALNFLKIEKFDLVFLDISMPVMDGVQTVTTIKANDNFKNLPVVALTAHAIIGYKEKYLNYGFDAYITKPVNDSVLFSCLEKFILSEKR